MSWIKKELDESAKARAEQNIHLRTVTKTRTEHKCNFCKHLVEIGDSAKVVTEEGVNNYTTFYKTYYYHPICFLQTSYSSIKPKQE